MSGGGARGAYEAGALKWLYKDADRCGIPYDVICGSSAGAINAALASVGTCAAIQRIEQLWRDIPAAKIMRYSAPVQNAMKGVAALQESERHGFPAKITYLARARKYLSAMGRPENLAGTMNLFDDEGMRSLIKRYAIGIGDLRTSLVVATTNVTEARCDAFYRFCGSHALEQGPLRSARTGCHTLTEDNLIPAVLASSAMPGAFPPVPIERPDTGEINVYVDGGLANGTPVGLAVDTGASDITVVLVTAAGEATDGMLESCHLPPRTFKELLLVCQAVMQHKIIADDLALAAARGVTIRVIRPHAPLKATVMAFDDVKAIDAAIDAGYRDAQQPALYAADAPTFVA